LEHPKYIARRQREGETVAPLTLRLNNNWIRDPMRLLKKVESDRGVTVSFASNRQVNGPTLNGWLHLYRFDVQDQPCHPPEVQSSNLAGQHRRRAAHEPRPCDKGPQFGPRTLHEAGLPQQRGGGWRHSGGARNSCSASAIGPSLLPSSGSSASSSSGAVLTPGQLPASGRSAAGSSLACEDDGEELVAVALVAVPEEASSGEAEEALASAHTPGAPERTPEPDAQHVAPAPVAAIAAGSSCRLDSSLAAAGAGDKGAATLKGSKAEDCLSSASAATVPLVPTRMKPKILQRSAALEEDAPRDGFPSGSDDPVLLANAESTYFSVSTRSASSSKTVLPPPPCSTVSGTLEVERWRHSDSAALPRLPEEPGEDEDDSPLGAVVHAAPSRLLAVPAKILQRTPAKVLPSAESGRTPGEAKPQA